MTISFTETATAEAVICRVNGNHQYKTNKQAKNQEKEIKIDHQPKAANHETEKDKNQRKSPETTTKQVIKWQ